MKKYEIRKIKQSLFVMLWLWCLAPHAYNDHRVAGMDSIEQALKHPERLSDEQLMNAYKSLMWAYLPHDGGRSAGYATQALALSYEHDWLNSRVDALRLLGLNAYGGGDYERALALYDWALQLNDTMSRKGGYEESTIDDNLSALYGSIANVYNMQDRLHLAIAYYQKALPLFEKYEWWESASILYYNVGELYSSMGNADEAESNYRKAVDIGTLTGDTLMVVVPYKGLAAIYLDRDDRQRAKAAIDTLYAYYSHHRDDEVADYVTTLCRKARYELKWGGGVAAAGPLAGEALSLTDHEMMSDTRGEVYDLCCEVAILQHRWHDALHFAYQALATDPEETYGDVVTYSSLIKIYGALGQADSVAEYTDRMHHCLTRFANSHYQSGLSEMQVLYDTEKKEAAIESLQRERRWMMWGSMLGGVVLLLIALLFFLLWRSVHIGRKSALFKAKLDGEVEERIRIARDLHDGLGGMLSLLRMKIEQDADKGETLQHLDATSRELRHVAHHLMPEQLLRSGLTTALSDLALSMPNTEFYNTGDDDRPLAKDLEIVLYRCTYELVNNAVKHSEAGTITIELNHHGSNVMLVVSDDGHGFDPSRASHGRGLKNISERIARYNGRMNIDSSPEGTRVSITVKEN